MTYAKTISWMLAGISLLLSGCSHRIWTTAHPRPTLSDEVGWALEPASRLSAVANRVLVDNPKPPPFDWGEGVMMAGMVQAGVVLHEPKYVEFVKAWADHWRQFGLDKVLAGTNPKLKGYCGHWGPGLAVIMLYDHTRDPVYLEMARQIAAFVEKDATRTSDGGLGHWRDNKELWVDTLYMACPVLSRLYQLGGEQTFISDASHQLDVYTKHCQDGKTGLYYHMYNEPAGKNEGVLWARGNGWVTMSFVEVLRQLDRRAASYERLHAAFLKQVDGVLATQDPQTGLWHTVLDRPESYIETSASAMFVYALAEAHRRDLLDKNPRDAVKKAVVRGWLGLLGKVDQDGKVFDVSGGTRPAGYKEYAEKPRGTYTWGTGAYLLAAAELMQK